MTKEEKSTIKIFISLNWKKIRFLNIRSFMKFKADEFLYTDLMIFRKVPLGFMKILIKQKSPLRAKVRFWGSRTLKFVYIRYDIFLVTIMIFSSRINYQITSPFVRRDFLINLIWRTKIYVFDSNYK